MLDDFTVDLATYVNVATIGDDPLKGVNTCVEQYYGVPSIIAEQTDE